MIIDNRRKVLELIDTLTVIAGHTSENFVYRGEAECHEDISSSLYRELYEIDNEHFDIMEAQQRQLDQAKQFTKETDDLRVLAEIQHRGGKTNLIDFSTDLNIALFFACKFSPNTDGRVIFLRYQKWDDYIIGRAVQPSNMADAQKSMLVSPKRGYIKDSDVIVYPIPHGLKPDILQYLESVYGITMATVYNDISGFIRHQKEFQDFEAEFYAGTRSIHQGRFKEAIVHLTNYLDNPATLWRRGATHLNRGIAYLAVGDVEKATDDFMRFDSYHWEGKPEVPSLIQELIDKRREEQELERQECARQSQVQGANAAYSVIHRIRLESHVPQGNSVDGTTFILLSEYGYLYQQVMPERPLLVTVPPTCIEGRWWFWFNRDGYRRVDAIEVVWGEPLEVTLHPKEKNAHLPEVTVTGTYTTDEVTA